VAEVSLQDERLAWLAIRDELRETCTQLPGLRLIRIFGGLNRSHTSHLARRALSEDLAELQMTKYALAADDLVRRFTHEERQLLRETGRVPEWYFSTVLAEAKSIKM
jgi:hypothetical protein